MARAALCGEPSRAEPNRAEPSRADRAPQLRHPGGNEPRRDSGGAARPGPPGGVVHLQPPPSPRPSRGERSRTERNGTERSGPVLQAVPGERGWLRAHVKHGRSCSPLCEPELCHTTRGAGRGAAVRCDSDGTTSAPCRTVLCCAPCGVLALPGAPSRYSACRLVISFIFLCCAGN